MVIMKEILQGEHFPWNSPTFPQLFALLLLMLQLYML